jgi:hypothetical protein
MCFRACLLASSAVVGIAEAEQEKFRVDYKPLPFAVSGASRCLATNYTCTIKSTCKSTVYDVRAHILAHMFWRRGQLGL